MGTVWLADKCWVGIPIGRRPRAEAWRQDSRSLVRGLQGGAAEKQGFFQRPPSVPLLLPPLQSDSYQEDIYPMTPGTEPALTPDEWLGGINRGTAGGGLPRRGLETAAFAFTLVHPLPFA